MGGFVDWWTVAVHDDRASVTLKQDRDNVHEFKVEWFAKRGAADGAVTDAETLVNRHNDQKRKNAHGSAVVWPEATLELVLDGSSLLTPMEDLQTGPLRFLHGVLTCIKAAWVAPRGTSLVPRVTIDVLDTNNDDRHRLARHYARLGFRAVRD